ncbi:LuxR C-terminal-related transcriptional regulator [Telmatospirillum sp. J64-1]|uniref:LuxR C-terminal-related transcriptional regulator n=1 Tax=Telmatospirillum sp. J64-1 TaxID=2502183 RepID=UPI00115D884D|nr:LuxR C-terminal-related transcriptional regulator [Telmatospirillum sp. J64-1]
MTEVPHTESTSPNESQVSASVAMAVDDERLVDEIVGRFDKAERENMVVYDDPDFLASNPLLIPAEVTIVALPVMRYLAKFHLEALNEFCNNNKVVLLIRSQDFLDSIGYLEFVEGVVFVDSTMDRIRDILDLSKAGYSILPPAAVMDIVTDRLRCDTIAKLNPIELHILDQVRLAKTNRAIARSLNLTEANVKTKVRAILKALKFQNRTEAAVFAARQGDMIRRQIEQRQEEMEETGPERERDILH